MNITSEQLRLYAVTDRTWCRTPQALLRQVEQAILGGAGLVQLREKNTPDEILLPLARDMTALCHRHGVRCLINDRVDVALATGADGVHLGQGDGDVARARRMLGPRAILGVSAHSVEEGQRAQSQGADYLGIGAAFVTGTKSDARAISHDTIRAITRQVPLPAVAIGGIGEDNILALSGCGLAGVAVVSALFGQKDVRRAAENLRRLAQQIAE